MLVHYIFIHFFSFFFFFWGGGEPYNFSCVTFKFVEVPMLSTIEDCLFRLYLCWNVVVTWDTSRS